MVTSISIKYKYICPIDETLTDSLTPSQSGPRSNGNEEVFKTPQNWSLTTRCSLTLYSGYLFSFEKSYVSAGHIVSVFKALLTEWNNP